MADLAKPRLGIGGTLILVAMGVFAFFVAMVAVPAISESSGIADEYVSFGLAGVGFVIAIGSAFWVKALNKRKPGG
jgi:hypothetical protein